MTNKVSKTEYEYIINFLSSHAPHTVDLFKKENTLFNSVKDVHIKEIDNTPIVLIDSCSFTYYRVTATFAWYKKNSKIPNLDDTEFMEALKTQYLSCLAKFVKISGVVINDMYLIRDCPRDTIWRIKHYSEYKKNRSIDSGYGPYIKYLNNEMSNKYKHIFRIEEAEADDVISILVDLFTIMYPNRPIYIVSGDSDYVQLLKYKNVKLYNPKKWQPIDCENPEEYLQNKIMSGDKSDNVPSIKNKECFKEILRNNMLINMEYIPRYIQDRVISALPEYLKTLVPANMRPKHIQLGLCCINTILRDKDIFCSRTMRLSTLMTKGVEEAKRLALQNCQDMITMIKWNAENGIRFFRLSSDIFPHISNPEAPKYTLDFSQHLLTEGGKLARQYKQRLTFHPGQFNVIPTPNENVFEKTCIELGIHAEILDRMGCDQDSIMVIHGGGLYGDKKTAIARFITNFYRLPENVQRRLVLENCEKSYSVEDCLEICEKINIPHVFDTHHYECYNLLHPNERLLPAAEYIPRILETWNRRGIKPKFHISTQCCGGRVGKHADYIDKIPDYLLNISQPVDIAVEAKDKEQAIYDLYKKYPQLDARV